MLGLAESWEVRVFPIKDFTPVNICCSLYGTVEKQREFRHSKNSKDSVEQNLPK